MGREYHAEESGSLASGRPDRAQRIEDELVGLEKGDCLLERRSINGNEDRPIHDSPSEIRTSDARN